MPISHVSKLYSVSDAAISKLLTDPSGGAATYGALTDLPGVREVGLTPEINSVSLIGDNVTLDQDSSLTALTVSFEHAKVSQDVLAILFGGAVTDAGVAPNQTATFKRINTDAFSYFKFQARTPTNGVDFSGGAARLVVHKCKMTGYELGFGNQDYQILSGEFTGVYMLSNGALFDLVFEETATALA